MGCGENIDRLWGGGRGRGWGRGAKWSWGLEPWGESGTSRDDLSPSRYASPRGHNNRDGDGDGAHHRGRARGWLCRRAGLAHDTVDHWGDGLGRDLGGSNEGVDAGKHATESYGIVVATSQRRPHALVDWCVIVALKILFENLTLLFCAGNAVADLLERRVGLQGAADPRCLGEGWSPR